MEFYLSFRELLGQELVDSFNYAFEKGEMLISQKKDTITLIPKKDKNRTLLDNWRPISLLNTDHKVAIKSISARIAKVLPSPCLLYTSPSPRDATLSRMPSSA